MPVLHASGIADILVAGLAELGEGKWTDISVDLQEFHALPNLMKKNRVSIQSGHAVEWTLKTAHNESARSTGLYSEDRYNVPNTLTTASVEWRYAEGSYQFDHREIDMNKGKRQIVDLLKSRRHDAMVSIAEFFEEKFWQVPASTNTLDPYGVPYYIVKSATDAATDTTRNGFNGSTPSGYTTVAGVNPTTYTRWRNYADAYTALTKDDAVSKIWRATSMTGFKPPVQSPSFNTGDRYQIYTTYKAHKALKNLAENQNDNLGSDLDSMHGDVRIRRIPINWVPQLDADTTDPFYGINWGVTQLAVKSNWWNKETVIDRVGGQHNVCSVFMDFQYQFIVRDRRRNWVISNGTTLP
jgi:hypothetical protein